MSNNKKVIISSLATVVAAGTIGVNVTNAHFAKNSSVREAIAKRDFVAFQNAVKDNTRLGDVDTESEFEAIVKAYELRKNGKYEEASEVLNDVGIESSLERSVFVSRANVRSAIQNSDWSEFQEAAFGKKIAKVINTEEKFNVLVEAQELREDGRSDEAREVLQSVGLKAYGHII